MIRTLKSATTLRRTMGVAAVLLVGAIASHTTAMNVRAENDAAHGIEVASRIAPVATATPAVRGITFDIDTTESYPKHRGALTTIGGHVEFAAGRGRIDVTSVRKSPAVSVNGVTIAPPLARVGDYYLFDSTQFTIVRPTSRTYSVFRLSRCTIRHESGLIPGEEMIRPNFLRIDTIRSKNSARLSERGSYALRTHTDRWHADGPFQPLARVWIDVQNAPAGEVSAVRFMAAAQALGTIPKGIAGIHRDSLQITSILIVGALKNGRAPLTLTSGQRFTGLRTAEIDPARLQIPAGFQETPTPN